MTVGADYRSTFDNSTNTSQKYQPLNGLVFFDQPNLYDELVDTRRAVFTTAGLLPAALRLFPGDLKHKLAQAERGKRPPLVVVSAARSAWIKKSLAAIAKSRQYDGIGDMSALVDLPADATCPVAYHPRRIGPDRNVYILVHSLDYDEYRKVLAGTGITVIGWEFVYPGAAPAANLPAPVPPPQPPVPKVLCGFGASRFAAIEFCKALWQLVPPGKWSYAWVMDDNTIGVKACPGFEAVEAAMTATDVAAGFSGATKLLTAPDITKWAKEQSGRRVVLPKAGGQGILQQAVLWNIEYLYDKHLNFSPIFTTSAEDVSLSLYFDLKGHPYRYYPGLTVAKQNTAKEQEKPGPNPVAPKSALDNARGELVNFIASQESRGVVAAKQPPPVTIAPLQADQRGVRTVLDFITQHYNNAAKNSQAASCAVEQIICDAIKQRLIRPDRLTEIFELTGNREQRVEWF